MLVLVHGAGGGAWEWDLWAEALVHRCELVLQPVNLEPAEGGLEVTRVEDYVGQIVAHCNKVSVQGLPLFLVGASMGGALVALASEAVQPAGIVFICSCVPRNIAPASGNRAEYPPVVRWAGGAVEETVAAMPDATLQVCTFAAARWRDESGAVLNQAMAWSEWDPSSKTKRHYLGVIPLDDDTVAPAEQIAFAEAIGAKALKYDGMSHVGPLLGERSHQVAAAVADWVLSCSSSS